MKKKIVAVLLAACLALAPSLSSADELMDILDISEYTSYKIVQRMKTMNVFLKHIYEYEQKGIRIITKYD